MNKITLPSNVTVVAVTKTLPASKIIEAYNAGVRNFGENYVEEFAGKYEELPPEITSHATFHMIGHVQGRKVKDVVRLFDWVDSVDSIKLARKLSKAAQEKHKILHVLLEVNISGEEGKSGFDMKEPFFPNVHAIRAFPALIVEGLMVMPPFVTNPEDNRLIFRQAKQLCAEMGLKELSMGTSQDYQVAIEEGATMVRLGTALFGQRTLTRE